jgi:hypothetical protein
VREVYFMADGEVHLSARVELDQANVLDEVTHAELPVADVYAGSIIGDSEVVEGLKHYKVTATVKSAECTVLSMSRSDFELIVLRAPDDTGEKVRAGVAAAKAFREERLSKLQKKKKKEKVEKFNEELAESRVASKMRKQVERANRGSFGERASTAAGGARRASRATFAPGDYKGVTINLKELTGLDDDAIKGVVGALPAVAAGGGRRKFGAPKAAPAESFGMKSDPYDLPGLKNNNAPTSPRTLRKLKSRSMAGLSSLGSASSFGGSSLGDARPEKDSPVGQHLLGFQHYGSTLQASFGEFSQRPMTGHMSLGGSSSGGGSGRLPSAAVGGGVAKQPSGGRKSFKDKAVLGGGK